MPAPVHLQPGQIAVRPVPDGDVFDEDDMIVLTPIDRLLLSAEWNGAPIGVLVETLAGYCDVERPGTQPLGSALNLAAVELARRWHEDQQS